MAVEVVGMGTFLLCVRETLFSSEETDCTL